MYPAVCSEALKEWAVAVKALDQGDQILLLRKGGIREPGKQFTIPHRESLLYPTFEHQEEALLKSEYHPRLRETLEEEEPGLVVLSHWAEVTDVAEVMDQEALDDLLPHHIWTRDYAQKRLNWKPRYTLSVMFLRVHRLLQPQALPILDEYTGCTSWVDLGQEIPLGAMSPVLPEEEYRERVKTITQGLRAYQT